MMHGTLNLDRLCKIMSQLIAERDNCDVKVTVEEKEEKEDLQEKPPRR